MADRKQPPSTRSKDKIAETIDESIYAEDDKESAPQFQPSVDDSRSMNRKSSASPPATPPPLSATVDNDDVDYSSQKVYRMVLSQLESSLRGAMPDWKRSKLASYLKV